MKSIFKVIDRFNVRVYGIFIRNNSVLIVKENIGNLEIVKFPGGGLEFGEGLKDGLKREIKEELELEISIKKHFYTTDFFQRSRFYKTEQVISVYYLINIPHCPPDNIFPVINFQNPNHKLTFFWHHISSLESNIFTFPIEKRVCKLLLKSFKN